MKHLKGVILIICGLVLTGCGVITENYLYRPDLLDRAMTNKIVNGEIVIDKEKGIDLTDADAVAYANFVDRVLSAKLEADRALIIGTELAKVGLFVGAQAVNSGLGLLIMNSSNALDLVVRKIIKPEERAMANMQGSAAIKRGLVSYYRARIASRKPNDSTPLISGKKITPQGVDLIDLTYSTLNSVAIANERALPNPDDLTNALKMTFKTTPDPDSPSPPPISVSTFPKPPEIITPAIKPMEAAPPTLKIP